MSKIKYFQICSNSRLLLSSTFLLLPTDNGTLVGAITKLVITNLIP